MGYAKLCYEPLWPIMTHNNPKYPHYDPVSAIDIVLQSSKILGLRLNFVTKILFLGTFGPETWKCFV